MVPLILASSLGISLASSPAAATGGGDLRAHGMAQRVAVGFEHACVLLESGDVVCWGDNQFAQLGHAGPRIGDDETPAQHGGAVELPGGKKAVGISAGDNKTCAVLADGGVTCWGSGGSHQPLVEMPMPGGRKAQQVAVGSEHVCALLADGNVTCWGRGLDGRLGYGNTNDIGTPAQNPVNGGLVPLPGGSAAIAVAAGGTHSCALLSSGGVACWGSGTYGQLGYGIMASIGANQTPAANGLFGGRVPLPGGRSATAIAAGGRHTCAILDNGGLACWGQGAHGQLGYGNTNNLGHNADFTPDLNVVNGGLVPLPGGRTVLAVSASEASTCAVLSGGDISCWGLGHGGRLGYGNTGNIGDAFTPATNPVNGGIVPLPSGARATAVAANTHSACAITERGQVVCWGLAAFGKLGYGNTTPIGDDETPADNLVTDGLVQLPALRRATAVAAGDAHSCALLPTGQVSCWGVGDDGRLGYGSVDAVGDDEAPGENPRSGGIVALPGGATAVQLSAGAAHTCALLTTGGVSCWGLGAGGRLGYGNTNSIGDDETPAQNPVNAGLVPLPGASAAVAVSAGGTHTCALLAAGTVTCWGSGLFGQLGRGTTDFVGDDETPASLGTVALPAGARAVAITAGRMHTCALLHTGRVVCWGSNGSGRLGYGNTTAIGDDETPAQNPVNGGLVPLPGSATAIAVGAGDEHTCALLSTGRVSCWGAGDDGRLGYGNTNSIGATETPAQNLVNGGRVSLPGGLTATTLAVGGGSTCAVLSDSSLTCWGRGVEGQLGYGNTNAIGATETPAQNPVNGGRVALPGGRNPVFIDIGEAHACVVAADGMTFCWGAGIGGRLGQGSNASLGDDEAVATIAPLRLPHPIRAHDLVAMAPQRLADTRPGFATVDGVLSGSGRLTAGSTLTVPVAGRAGLPADARAVLLTIVAVSPSAAGFVTVYPCHLPRPNAANLNYQSGVTTANTAVVALSPAGTVCVFVNQSADLVVDVAGAMPRTSAFTAIVPARLADTRPSLPTVDGQSSGGGTRPAGSVLQIPVTGRAGVPDGTRAVAVNIAAVTPAANGFVTAFPCGTLRPTVSSLNYRAGTTTANFVHVGLGTDGSLCVFTNQAADLVVDIVGYHRSDLPANSRFQPLPPARLVDTRPGAATDDGRLAGGGAVIGGTVLVVPVAGRFPAQGAVVASVNITAVDPTASGFATLYPCDRPQPEAATFNYRAGQTRSIGVLATLAANGTLCVFTNRTTHFVVDVNGGSL